MRNVCSIELKNAILAYHVFCLKVVLQKLWPLNDTVADKFKVIRCSLSRSLNQGNAVRNADKLKNDFYFTTFHPVQHYSFQVRLCCH